MFRNKVVNIIFSIILAASMITAAGRQASAQDQPPRQNPQTKKVTQEEREAAADRAKAKGFVLAEVGQAQMAVTYAAPHYFSVPNYANSPRRLAGANVLLSGGGGTGATASATVDPATGAVTGLTLLTPGSMYKKAPTVYITSPVAGGTGATGTATITGSVAGLVLTAGGSGYTTPLTVTISGGGGTGATGRATVTAKRFVNAVTVTNPGTGYKAPVTVVFTGGSPTTPATAFAKLGGPVIVAKVNAGGGGYTAPVVAFSGGGGTGAAGFARGVVDAVSVVSGGSGYCAPVVSLTGGNGTGASATATIDGTGVITGFSVVGGANYKLAPTVSIVDTGLGTGAAATASIDGLGAITGIAVDVAGLTYCNPVIAITDSTGPGTGATATAILDGTGAITGFVINTPGSGYVSPVVTISDSGKGVGAAAAATIALSKIVLTSGGANYISAPNILVTDSGLGAGAIATATIQKTSILGVSITNGGTGYLTPPTVSFVDAGGTGTGATATATINTTSGTIAKVVLTAGGTGYSSAPTVAITGGTGTGATATATIRGSVNSLTLNTGGSGYVTPGIEKFIDTLPGLGSANFNNLGQYIPVALADVNTYPDSDYYEIAVVQYREKMHSSLPATLLRGYVQLETPDNAATSAHIALANANQDGTSTPIMLNGNQVYAYDNPHYLGPIITATKNRPTRILFRNLLPTGVAGNLFIPTDTSLMGAGPGPLLEGATETDPQNPMCGNDPKPVGCYSENRATLHLHGGLTPWISDGTPHQWVTPATEGTAYPKGVSVRNVPDMPDPGPGAITFFYTNQQSARLLFYHDHAYGITRLNVYAGEAAGYLITDDAEQKLINDGTIPADQIPLIVQDKTFVPDAAQLAASDPTWDTARWGGIGQLWVPHVYVPAQSPGDSSGVNQFGRWAYGPWFWPPTNNVTYPPIANPYYSAACDPNVQWCEPAYMPSTPFVSMGMESFHDTPLVNGTAYPSVTLDPKSYRFRILNAANDRFWNLQFYVADASGKEVALNAAEVAAALTDPAVFPTPDLALSPAGPSWIQIGTEGGFLPSPTVIPPQVMTWVTDPTVFNAGNADQHSLLLGPAERADVIVDFSAFAGQTLILYNDAPAAFPARDPRYDYYTGNGDYTDTGGAPPTIAGFGPNTRTVMQVKINAAPVAAPFNLAALEAAFAHHADGSGVFESSQNPIIVGQGAYNAALGTTFQDNGPRAGLVQIFDEILNFDTVAGVPLSMAFERKAIHDEQSAAFDPVYGRMSGNLGLEAPNAQNPLAQNLVLYPYNNPATEVLNGVEMAGLDVTPISTTTDGTQIWKITHNGVDTHPIHFHLFDVQVLNRVGWDGIIRKPDANEIGWKDTVRISPLEDTIVAVRPIIPKMPFGVPDSLRLLNPTINVGSEAGFVNTDASGNPIVPAITNQIVNFGWEYVWHCHILSHEEMDMMRPMAVSVDHLLPAPPVVGYSRDGGTGVVTLTWNDETPVSYANLATWGNPRNEIEYRVERAVVSGGGSIGPYTVIGSKLANQTGYVDSTAALGTNYSYRVVVVNASGSSTSLQVGGASESIPATPSAVAVELQAGPQINVTWTDNATNETYYLIERSMDAGTYFTIAVPPANAGTGVMNLVDTSITSNHTYRYRISAINSAGPSTRVTSGPAVVPAVPTAPSNLAGSVALVGSRADITLTWLDNSLNETGFVLERATNAAFTNLLISFPISADTLTITQTGLFRGQDYYYRIRAVNIAGSSLWSNTLLVHTP